MFRKPWVIVSQTQNSEGTNPCSLEQETASLKNREWVFLAQGISVNIIFSLAGTTGSYKPSSITTTQVMSTPYQQNGNQNATTPDSFSPPTEIVVHPPPTLDPSSSVSSPARIAGTVANSNSSGNSRSVSKEVEESSAC